MKQDEIFQSLTRNAFDFLKRGIDEFDQAPKYSVIHFCAAVEMLLKARLMKEHWSLVVSKPEQASLAKFMAGDFMSVTMDEARARIRDIVGEEVADDAFNSFRTLANHRNKMVHFFHADVDGDDKAKAQIVAEYCRSWFHLHRLLNRWGAYFGDFHAEIASADCAMKKHRKYLTAKFNALKSDLDAARKAGTLPRACGACGFEAAIPTALDAHVALLECKVCDHAEAQVSIDCPHCQSALVISGEGYATCTHGSCGKSIEPKHLISALSKHSFDPNDFEADFPANCGSCEGHHTVVQCGGQYFCACCFEISDHVEKCESCNEMNTGDMEFSRANGCGQCEGQWGHTKDD